jgi:CheY-like chemotaxis protein
LAHATHIDVGRVRQRAKVFWFFFSKKNILPYLVHHPATIRQQHDACANEAPMPSTFRIAPAMDDSLFEHIDIADILAPPPALSLAHDGTPFRRILLVDDDICVLALAGAMLSRLGHRVVPAQNSQDALGCLGQDPAIDYLVTDIVMPNDMNGVQLMIAARAARPGLPTLLASSYPLETWRALGTIPADVAFIAKPYSLAEIGAQIGGAG